MNFLAHLYLSGESEKIMVGNFIGDFVKGNQLDLYEEDIQKGIRLHREIDSFTDTNSIVLQSKKRLRPNFGHYAPVIVDVFYDHFLAREWSAFSTVELKTYTERFYQMISRYRQAIPEGVNHMLVHMKQKNWLYHYQFFDGLNRSLTGMSRRTKFESKMELATEFLKEHYEAFREEFHAFFPQLRQHVNTFLT